MTDEQWARLGPLLPPQRPRTGRPARDHRTVLSAILWVLRTGAPWRDLPERFGPWSTAWTRFRRWIAAGVWPRVLTVLQREADRDGAVDMCSAGVLCTGRRVQISSLTTIGDRRGHRDTTSRRTDLQ